MPSSELAAFTSTKLGQWNTQRELVLFFLARSQESNYIIVAGLLTESESLHVS